MSDLQISRNAEIPDALRIARAKASPNLGPRLLFFSGGSALNGLSRRLKAYTHNSAHLITPFDSGGSSQILRQAFDMPAVGDLRSRLMALADESDLGQPDISALFNYRLPADALPGALDTEFRALLDGSHKLIRDVFQPMRSLILRPLHAFAQNMPEGFDLRHASIGNLILAGGYLTNERALEPVLFLMSKMVDVQGTVRAVVDENLQIGAELADGSHVVGQRNLTGKETAPLTQSIRRVYLSDGTREIDPRKVRLPKRNRRLIETADLICYPPGSLFSSVIANLLPQRVGTSIAARSVPKVYVPSLGTDPECIGLDLSGQVAALLSVLRRDAGAECPVDRLLTLVLYDASSVEPDMVRKTQADHSVLCVPGHLVGTDRSDRYDPDRLCDALVSLT